MDANFLNKTSLMFHEILDNGDTNSGWHTRSNGKYTISKNKFLKIISIYGSSVNYTFDDGGISNLYAANQLKSSGIQGIFFICSAYIGEPGFLNLDQINNISKYHHVFAHGHKHIMKRVNFSDLFLDWEQSLSYMKNNNFNSNIVCLPGGYFTLDHYKVFSDLGVKYIFHSAPYNFILKILYKENFVFIPRIIVTEKFKLIRKTNYIGIKSLIKQAVDNLSILIKF